MTFTSEGPEETQALAAELLAAFGENRIIALYGDLGAGKTTLVQAFCEELGVTDNVKSPTFSIVNEYESDSGNIFHFDFYRIEKITEVFDLGFEEYIDSGAWCFMEWPERIESVLPEETVIVRISEAGASRRKITIG